MIELTYDPVNDSNRVLVKKAFKGYRRVSGRCCFETGTGRKGNLEPDERGDQGESQKKDQKKYQAKDQMKEEKTG